MSRLPVTPSQTIGPFFHFALDRPEWNDLTAGGARGERIVIEGRVLDGDGTPVDDALIEIWQANANGEYDDPGFGGFGRAITNAAGGYRFTTIRPGLVRGNGNALQAPHINVTVFARGLLKQLATRIYFAGDPSNDTDAVLSSVADVAARRTLIAKPEAGGHRFDIVLQGPGETVFFDV